MSLLGSEEAGIGSIPTAAGADSPGVSPTGGGTLLFAGINTGATELASAPAADYDEGQLAWIQSVGAYFELRSSALTVDGITTVAASGKTGFQWLRLLQFNAVWAARTTWFLDPQNVAASDENDGSSGAPLKTFQELSRRMQSMTVRSAMTLNLLSDCLSTDVADFSSVGLLAAVTILGTPGTSIWAGTVSSAVAQSTGPAADYNSITDNTLPVSFTASGLMATGVLFQRTNSTACYWFAAKDLGSKTARISTPMDTTGSVVTALAPGDSYTVRPLPKVFGLRWNTQQLGNGVRYQFISESAASSTQLQAVGYRYTASWVINSRHWAGGFFGNVAFATSQEWVQGAGIPATIQGGEFIGTGATSSTITNTVCLLSQVLFQGHQWFNGQNGQTDIFGRVTHCDCTVDAQITKYWSALLIYQSSAPTGYGIGGTGNSAALITVAYWSKAAYINGVPVVAGSSSSPTPITIGTTPHAVADLPVLDTTQDIGVFASS